MDLLDLPDLPGTPAWDEQAAADLVAVAEAATRLLDEQWQLFDRGWWELLTAWTGPARAAYNEKLTALRPPAAHLRDELAVIPARVADARTEAHGARRQAYRRAFPVLGTAWDVLDLVADT